MNFVVRTKHASVLVTSYGLHVCLLASTMSLSVASVAYYFLEPMLLEHGLGTSPGKCDHLALDEPDALLTLPT